MYEQEEVFISFSDEIDKIIDCLVKVDTLSSKVNKDSDVKYYEGLTAKLRQLVDMFVSYTTANLSHMMQDFLDATKTPKQSKKTTAPLRIVHKNKDEEKDS